MKYAFEMDGKRAEIDFSDALTIEELERLLDKNDGVTTVCFMGGDATPEIVCALAEYLHEIKHLKVSKVFPAQKGHKPHVKDKQEEGE